MVSSVINPKLIYLSVARHSSFHFFVRNAFSHTINIYPLFWYILLKSNQTSTSLTAWMIINQDPFTIFHLRSWFQRMRQGITFVTSSFSRDMGRDYDQYYSQCYSHPLTYILNENTVKCPVVQYNAIFHRQLRWLKQNINQSVKSQITLHISP